MGNTEKAVDINMTSSLELSSSLLEQLGEALTELESQKVVPDIKVSWKDTEAHFRDLESMMKEKIEELEAKEREYIERKSHYHMLLAERETEVVAKEQDLLDRVQELKDAAMAAITKAWETEPLESASVENGNANEVRSSVDDENASSHKLGETSEGAAVEVVIPLAELTQFCEQMDSIGLVKLITENLKNFSSDWKEQLSVVLGCATEPARLVLKALDEGFFPPKEMTQEGNSSDAALCGMRKSCLILMEAISAFMSKADLVRDFLNPEIQQEAKSIANYWKLKFSEDSINAANGNSLEAEAFLRLLAIFRIASHFDEEELCKYVLAVAHHRQATELCRSLDLTQKIPGLVETLIGRGRLIDAVHFILAFELSEAFPAVPLLRAYLKELRRNSQGNGSTASQNNCNARELKALRDVIECVEEYKLEDYPLDPLYKRVYQLDKAAKGGDRKRSRETGKPQDHQKKPRFDGGFRGPRGQGRHGPPPPRATYTGVQERYNPAVPNPYSYPVSSAQPPYAAQANDQTYYQYPQGTWPQGAYSQAAPSYGAYSQAAPSYGAYLQPSHQPQI